MEYELPEIVIGVVLYLIGSVVLCYIWSLLNAYFQGGVCTATTRLDGKVVLITGGSTGLGKETAMDLSKRGAKVYIACPDSKLGLDAVADIKKESRNDDVHHRILDLASFSSIRKFVQEVTAEENYLHVLINNAGIFRCPYWKTEDGLEMQMGVNHFGHFLLTNLLLTL